MLEGRTLHKLAICDNSETDSYHRGARGVADPDDMF